MLDDVASVTLQSALAGLGRRQQATANNIANVETPGYQATAVDFESSLAAAVQSGEPGRFAINADPTGDASGVNGNNVSLDREVVTATKTTLQEQLLTSALTSKYGLISTVLKG